MDMLKGQRAEQRTIGPFGLGIALLAAMAVTATIFAVFHVYVRVREKPAVEAPRRASPGPGSLAASPTPGSFDVLALSSSAFSTPIIADIDQDGAEDLVVLLRGQNADQPEVWVAGLTGHGYSPMWVRGPYEVQAGQHPRLVQTADRLVLVRTQETIATAHVLTLRGGAELAAYALPNPEDGVSTNRSVCALASGGRRVRVGGHILEVDTGVLADAKDADRCADERPRCGSGRKTECVARDALGVKDQVIDPATTWVDKDGWATTVGSLRTSLGPGRPTIMAFGMHDGRVAWDEVVSSDDSAEDHALIGAASDAGRLVLFTKEQPGKFLVRSLDAHTGDEQWHVDVDQPAHSGVSVRVTIERVYVTLTFAGRERIQVYEAASGKDFGAIQDVTSSRVAGPGGLGLSGYGGSGGYGGYYGYRAKSYPYPAYGYPVE